jgi:hypothetical protein
MIFSVDEENKTAEPVEESGFSELGILEEDDIQEWAIDEPRLLGEDLLVISSEYSNFEDTRDRLDILALDRDGNLVVVELKRDQADRTTDLQAIKYAGYCATLTAEDIQKEYREFHNEREEDKVTPEEVGEEFSEFLIEDVVTTEDGWVEFELDNKPRILLAAGEYGTEVTAPVMWLIEEYGLDITCTKLQAYEKDGKTLLNSQQVIPPAEAEDYMTERREKKEEQETELSEKQKLQKEFWTEFRDKIRESSTELSERKPRPERYYENPIGKAGMHLSFINYIQENELLIRLIIKDDEEAYYELEDQKDEIEREIEEEVSWKEPEETYTGNMRSKIDISRDANIRNREKWDEYFEWMLESGNEFREAFYDRIQQI